MQRDILNKLMFSGFVSSHRSSPKLSHREDEISCSFYLKKFKSSANFAGQFRTVDNGDPAQDYP